jgi:hypothetical protein
MTTGRASRTPRPARPHLAACIVPALLALSLSACRTRRTLSVESNPPGAVVRFDDEVIGVTPVEHEFLHYGKRRVTLYLPGYRTWSKAIEFEPPWYGRFPLDILTQVLIPLGLDDDHPVEVDLVPDDGERGDPDLEAFVQRAQERRRKELRRRERQEAAEPGPAADAATEAPPQDTSGTATGPEDRP